MKTQLKTTITVLLAAVLAFGTGCQKDPENGGNNNEDENGDGKRMKHITRFVFAALMLLFALPAWAYDFMVNGIYYNITNAIEPYEVSVTNNVYSNDPSYSGDVIIPEIVVYEGVSYSVNSIGNKAFANCGDLISVIIPSTVKSIDESAFSGCIGLTSIDIPISVTSIGNWAFYGCSSITSLTIPQSVISIGYFVFISCSSLEQIMVDDENQYYDSREGCNAIIETSTNILLTGCKTTVIPHTVVSIGNNAFAGCSGLTSVTIPNTIITIDEGAFDGCSGLTSIAIPSSVTFLGNGVFNNCSSLEQIIVDVENQYYDSRDGCNAIIETSTNTLMMGCKNTEIPNTVTSIGDSAFRGCSALVSITIPNSVTTIGKSAFCWCNGLTSITIPNSVASIDAAAFYGCSNLTSVVIPNSVSEIKSQTFFNCMSLTSVTIPSSVNSIGNESFSRCRSLTSIIIPASVTSIGEKAFYKCFGLTSITIPYSVTFIGENAFYDCRFLNEVIVEATDPPACGVEPFPDFDIPISVPCGSKEAYSNAEVWKEYTNINAEFQLSFSARSSDETLGNVRIVHQPDCENNIATVIAEPTDGNMFVSWTANGQVVSTANPYTFAVENDIELVANFSGTGVDEDVTQKITISPNPTKDFVNIECEDMKGITLWTLDGRASKAYDGLNANAFTLDLSDLPQGIYILRIRIGEGIIINKKILKE